MQQSSTAPRVWWRGWTPLVVLPPAVFFLAPHDAPRWAVMWSLAVTMYGGFKWVTWRRARPMSPAPTWKHVAYLFAWPGLDANAFLSIPATPIHRPTQREWAFAIFKPILGGAILFLLPRFVSPDWPYLVGWVGMIGIGFILHFGLFHVLSCLWRARGLDAKPLMNWPIASTSVSEYWSRRWNTAFRDMAHQFLFRPLTKHIGPRGAILVGFFFSGVVHDIVISLPARGGYGLPTLFFILQSIAILVERTKPARAIGLGDGVPGRLFTTAVILLPAPLLFHRPFVVDVIVPFMHAIGAL